MDCADPQIAPNICTESRVIILENVSVNSYPLFRLADTSDFGYITPCILVDIRKVRPTFVIRYGVLAFKWI